MLLLVFPHSKGPLAANASNISVVARAQMPVCATEPRQQFMLCTY